MPILKYRLNRKNASGSYDTIHYETSSNIVMRPSGRSVEQDLAAYLPRTQDTDDVPQSLSFGSSLVCPTKIYVAIGNSKIASLQYEEVVANNKFNVTIVTNTGTPVVNTQVHCTTNGQNYTTNSSGQIPQTIETESDVKSLAFTWSRSDMGSWTTADGSLQQASNITYNYTGTATISSGNLFSGNCSTTVQTTSGGTSYRINANASTGTFITIGTRQYLITQVDSSTVYAILRYYEERCQFDAGGSVEYLGSDIAAKCDGWYSSAVPSVWRTSAYAFTIANIEGIHAHCFIPTYNQVNG